MGYIFSYLLQSYKKKKRLYECQEYQTIDKKIETIDMTLVCKELVQPYERGLGT